MDTCPECGGPLEWDEVDIGVGVQRGPEWCLDPDCAFNKHQSERLEDTRNYRDDTDG